MLEENSKGKEDYYQEKLDDWMLLFAIDSEDKCDMLWWDSSILEFYVNRKDLMNMDFSGTFCLINH